MGKVVHLTDDAHDQAKAYCQKHGLNMKEWVAQLIDKGIAQVTRLPIDKKKLETCESEGEPEPYNRPPFWTGQQPK